MATSIASQLAAIRSIAHVDSAPQKRPFTRPSILFDPKEAADIDIETLFNIAIQGLEVLISNDERIHLHNYEDLILCALPYHDTHAFVRIVQILDIRNGTWGFLEGVKVSGAPPPRMVIVQQCLHDKGVLEVLCNYASPSKKFQPSKNVIGFCTAVFIEVLGTVVTVDDDILKRILPFVSSGLQHGINGVSDHKLAVHTLKWADHLK
ncbi:U3 small nucleolar RNA-associated protein [Trifolium pratense]|uniref:U3 small nucleolar RNA-associated protein n=1 Tax=Trifolium pratense TaxID=57577 RepID=A0A2K3LFU0_TRIPR|nr:U3 small nucleolar RNA-associated protein [Trifolium pratense]